MAKGFKLISLERSFFRYRDAVFFVQNESVPCTKSGGTALRRPEKDVGRFFYLLIPNHKTYNCNYKYARDKHSVAFVHCCSIPYRQGEKIIFIAGEDCGIKLEKAKELNVPIISEYEFFKMLDK